MHLGSVFMTEVYFGLLNKIDKLIAKMYERHGIASF